MYLGQQRGPEHMCGEPNFVSDFVEMGYELREKT